MIPVGARLKHRYRSEFYRIHDVGTHYKCEVNRSVGTSCYMFFSKTKECTKRLEMIVGASWFYGELNPGDQVKDKRGNAWTVKRVHPREGSVSCAVSNIDVAEECVALNYDNLTVISPLEYRIRRIVFWAKKNVLRIPLERIV